MLSIDCRFDTAAGPSGMDPLGKLLISDGEAEILIDDTYLDSWLAALVDCAKRLGTETHISLETEEREHMEIQVLPDGRLVIEYEGKRVTAARKNELEIALRPAVAHFLAELGDSPEARQNSLIDPLRRFSATTPN